MPRPNLALAALGCAAAVLGTAAPAAAAPLPGAVTSYTAASATSAVATTYAARLHALVNAERVKAGRRPLALSGCAAGFARSWATTLAARGTLAHQDLGRVLRTCRHTRSGENVAYTSGTPESMVRMWMASPGHRANILSTAYTHAGVGAVRDSRGRWFAAQVFARG